MGDTEEVVLDILSVLMWAVGGFLAGAVASVLLTIVVAAIRRGRSELDYLTRRLRARQRIFFLVLGTSVGLVFGTRPGVVGGDWPLRPLMLHVLQIVLILAAANVVAGIVHAIQDSAIHASESRGDVDAARRVKTQMNLITQVGVVVVWLIGLALVLLTFDAFRAVGASMVASAGILSIIAGLAAQSTLANIFAGLQLVFSDAIRVGDVVNFKTQTCTVEEITLSYLVLRIWDGRRLVVPSTQFTSETFENWTKTEREQVGAVLFDLDWMLPVEAIRAEVLRFVEAHELWDGRSAAVVVTDAQGGHVTVRATVSGKNNDDVWVLQCALREHVVSWLQSQAPYALPRTRLEPETTPAPPAEVREQLVAETQEALAAEQLESQEKTILLPATTAAIDDEPRRKRRFGR
ncbi:MAG: mechanosensitive ion channel [Propionibacteriaceae bacterium]|nr:mechanosensitive ion channel [Propionibacteriaceae bacterium]